MPDRPATVDAFQTDDAGAPNSSASWVDTFLNARAGTIYAGSSQIQRNIIGEMVLGLPKEPKARRDAGLVVGCRAAVRPAVAGGAAPVATTRPDGVVAAAAVPAACPTRSTCASGG